MRYLIIRLLVFALATSAWLLVAPANSHLETRANALSFGKQAAIEAPEDHVASLVAQSGGGNRGGGGSGGGSSSGSSSGGSGGGGSRGGSSGGGSGGGNSGGGSGSGNSGGGSGGGSSNPIENVIRTVVDVIANITSFLNLRVFLPTQLFTAAVSATVDALFRGAATQLSNGITMVVASLNIGALPTSPSGPLAAIHNPLLEASKGVASFVMIISMLLLGLSAMILYVGGSPASVGHLPKAALSWLLVLIFAMNGSTLVFNINQAANHVAAEICKQVTHRCLTANDFAAMVVPSPDQGAVSYIIGIVGSIFTLIALIAAFAGFHVSAILTSAISPLAIATLSLPAGRGIFNAWVNMYGRLIFAFLFTFFIYAALAKLRASSVDILLKMVLSIAGSGMVMSVIMATIRDNIFLFIPTMANNAMQAFRENVSAVSGLVAQTGSAMVAGAGSAVGYAMNTAASLLPSNQAFSAAPLYQIPPSTFPQDVINAPLYPSLSSRNAGSSPSAGSPASSPAPQSIGGGNGGGGSSNTAGGGGNPPASGGYGGYFPPPYGGMGGGGGNAAPQLPSPTMHPGMSGDGTTRVVQVQRSRFGRIVQQAQGNSQSLTPASPEEWTV